jgi:hypothetical protein
MAEEYQMPAPLFVAFSLEMPFPASRSGGTGGPCLTGMAADPIEDLFQQTAGQYGKENRP